MTPADLIPFIDAIEQAIDARTDITRVRAGAVHIIENARIEFTRGNVCATIKVRTRRQRNMCPIDGHGETVEAATANLIDRLDIWATAIKGGPLKVAG